MIKIEKLNPFGRMCISLGMLPSSYKESLTYEEQLLWFMNYLQENVIPAVNNNAEALEELQEYVSHYFDNLDVQQEINNKLDEMAEDGSLINCIKNYIDPLYQGYVEEINEEIENQNQEISDFKTEVNSSIDNMNNIIENTSSGSPLVASSESEMTDTSRIYVNTSDGKWYYYDGESWLVGGTYQSTEIPNNSISVFKLENLLQSNFSTKFGNHIDLGLAYVGYYDKNGDLVSNNDYLNFQNSLTNGKTYCFYGYDSGNAQSLVIKDNNGNLIYASNPGNTSQNSFKIFECKENNLTAYISCSKNAYDNGTYIITKLFGLYELVDIYNNLKYNSIPTELASFQGFTNASSTTTSVTFVTSDENGIVKLYQMNKGVTYRISAWNYALICGLCIIDNLKTILYTSSTSSVGSRTQFNYEFTAQKDGIIILTTYQPAQMPTSIEIVNNNIDIVTTNSKLYGKKISLNGDSICSGVGFNGGYGKIIADKYNMTYENIAVAGSTIASDTYSGQSPRTWINETITNMSNDSDFAILEGGVNDSSLSVPLGSISSGYNDTLDTSTYYGAFEYMLKQLITRFAGKKYGYIAVHQMTANYRITNDPSTSYYWASKKCCEKWGVPFLDLNDKVPPFAFLINTPLSSLPTTYTKDGDGWHPNEIGYKRYYVDKIEKWLETL